MNYYERRIVRERRRVMRMVLSSVMEWISELVVGFMMLFVTFYILPIVAIIARGLWG